MNTTIPAALFAYARPRHLGKVLESLRANGIPLLYAFSDGPRTPEQEPAVAEVRRILRAIDWCKVVLVERDANLGLGRSILAGVSQVLDECDSVIVFEDDLVCVPGTYQYLSNALARYRDTPAVMSVTGWTHPRVTPSGVTDQPYFDGRAECWVWGTWARVWPGMRHDAKTLMGQCKQEGIDVYRYGADLPAMAEVELQKNIWAVRFLFLHILNRGLCLRPPRRMVEHIGFDAQASNTRDEGWLSDLPLGDCPSLPDTWPEPIENAECSTLWQRMCGARPPSSSPDSKVGRTVHRAWDLVARPIGHHRSMRPCMDRVKDITKLLLPPIFLKLVRSLRKKDAAPVVTRPADPPLPVEWEYIPEGWAYVEKHPEIQGWNVQSILETYKRKWPRFQALTQNSSPLGIAHESDLVCNTDLCSHNIVMSFAYVLALAAHDRLVLPLLDWGGGIGHYYLLAKTLLPGVTIEYHSKDVPLLADYGAQLFPDQYFSSDDSCLSRTYPLVMASVSIQYEQHWKELLGRLARASEEYLYVTGLPVVSKAASYVFVQRPYAYGYNTEYLGWCLNRDEFVSCVEANELKMIREFVVGHKPFIRGAPEQNEYRGFLFRSLRSTERKGSTWEAS